MHTSSSTSPDMGSTPPKSSGNLESITTALELGKELVAHNRMTIEESVMLATTRNGKRAMDVIDSRIIPVEIYNLEEFSALKSKLIHLYVTGIIGQETYNKLDSIRSIRELDEHLKAYSDHFAA